MIAGKKAKRRWRPLLFLAGFVAGDFVHAYIMDRQDSGDFVRLPCHSVMTGDKFYFAWKTSRRRERGLQVLRRWLVDEAIRGGLRGE